MLALMQPKSFADQLDRMERQRVAAGVGQRRRSERHRMGGGLEAIGAVETHRHAVRYGQVVARQSTAVHVDHWQRVPRVEHRQMDDGTMDDTGRCRSIGCLVTVRQSRAVRDHRSTDSLQFVLHRGAAVQRCD